MVNECIGQANMQRQLEGVASNRAMYELVVKDMRALGYESTWQECRMKIKNLTQRYRKRSDWY